MRRAFPATRFFSIVIALAVAPGSGAATWFVDDSAPAGGDGTSWNSAFQTLNVALAASAADDEIHIGQGTYKPTTAADPTATFVIGSGLRVLGGYAGVGAADPSLRNPLLYVTTLSGELPPAGMNGNSYRVVTIAEADATTLLDGCTVRDGFAAIFPNSDHGAGIYCPGGAPEIHDCVIRNNTAIGGGAGIYTTGSPFIHQCTIVQNVGLSANDDVGGGLWSDGGAPIVAGCEFIGNNGDDAGSAIACTNGSILIQGSIFNDNAVVFAGGAIDLHEASATIVGCKFVGNGAVERGGAISTQSGPLELIDSDFEDNSSKKGGAVFLGDPSPNVIRGCSFTANTAMSGGAVYAASPVAMTDDSFVSNKAGDAGVAGFGGAVWLESLGSFTSKFDLLRCTFIANEAGTGTASANPPGSGGAIYNDGSARVVNCRFLGGTASRGGAIYVGTHGLVRVQNAIFSGNAAAERGGALFNDSGTLHLSACTLSGNTATLQAGGFIANGAIPDTRLTSCILWGNAVGASTALASQYVDAGGGEPSIDWSTIQGLTPGATLGGVGNSGADPLLSAPAGPDGDPGTEDDDLRLIDGSPAIDSGSNSGVELDELDADGDGVLAELTPVDVSGAPRFTDVPRSEDGGCGVAAIIDRGALEHAGVATSQLLGDLDGDGNVNGRDLGVLLGTWGFCSDSCCIADLDGDGYVSAPDLFLLIAELWQAGSTSGGGAER